MSSKTPPNPPIDNLEKFIHDTTRQAESLMKLVKTMDINQLQKSMIKEKKNIEMNGAQGIISLMANGSMLLEFHETKAGPEIFKTIGKELISK